jgi:RNA polymerase sigma-70 factor, ECF subfamily
VGAPGGDQPRELGVPPAAGGAAGERAGRGGRTDALLDPDAGAALAVRQAVAALPPRQRAALVLRHVGGYSVAETAALLDVSEGAVKQLTHRAAVALRHLLPAELPEAPDVR